jgi:hypothetical protein
MVMTYDNVHDHASPAAQRRLAQVRDAAAAPANGIHLHIHDQEAVEHSCCAETEDRVANLERAVTILAHDRGYIDAADDAGLDPHRHVMSAEETEELRRRTADEAQPDDDYVDAGTGAKNRGIPASKPKIDVPPSKLPDIADINRKNQAFSAGGLSNNYSGPSSDGGFEVSSRLSTTPKVLDPGKTFGVTADSKRQGQFYAAQQQRTARLVQAIEAKNKAFYAKRGDR